MAWPGHLAMDSIQVSLHTELREAKVCAILALHWSLLSFQPWCHSCALSRPPLNDMDDVMTAPCNMTAIGVLKPPGKIEKTYRPVSSKRFITRRHTSLRSRACLALCVRPTLMCVMGPFGTPILVAPLQCMRQAWGTQHLAPFTA